MENKSIVEDYKGVTEEQYDDMLGVLPPIWGPIHTKKLQDMCNEYPRKLVAVQCFQVGEASGAVNGSPTFDTYGHVRDERGNNHYFYIGIMQRLDRKTCGNPWNY